jgi:mono/diheme cytochrome c family protein
MNKKTFPARVLLLIAALTGGSCVSLEQAAPLVETLPLRLRAGTSAQLAHGRELYITKCAKCHSVEPVRKYPLAQWEHEILPEMNEETKLTPQESAAVRAYVLTVLKTPAV